MIILITIGINNNFTIDLVKAVGNPIIIQVTYKNFTGCVYKTQAYTWYYHSHNEAFSISCSTY